LMGNGETNPVPAKFEIAHTTLPMRVNPATLKPPLSRQSEPFDPDTPRLPRQYKSNSTPALYPNSDTISLQGYSTMSYLADPDSCKRSNELITHKSLPATLDALGFLGATGNVGFPGRQA
jgi:hypothetical protein